MYRDVPVKVFSGNFKDYQQIDRSKVTGFYATYHTLKYVAPW